MAPRVLLWLTLLVCCAPAWSARDAAKPAGRHARHHDAALSPESQAAMAALPIDPDASPAAVSPSVSIKGASDNVDLRHTQQLILDQIEEARRRTVSQEDDPLLQRETATPFIWVLRALSLALYGVALLIAVYAARHMAFTLNRLFGHQRHPYLDIETAQWPKVTVFIAAHNEEAVIADAMEALLESDYPPGRMIIMPVNDRSTDGTRAIIDRIAARRPDAIRPFHRTQGKPGKAAALKDATALIDTELFIVFDADYLPSRGLLKQLIAPFFDPEVGAVMGRVVPLNPGANLLTRMLDMERAGGYQVDQQARMNMKLVPQYGGTVGGIRVAALNSVGGWHDDVLAEDTDLTYRLLIGGWLTVYTNRSECYEEVPESWPVRIRQLMRWTRGHNQALARHVGRLLSTRGVQRREKLDGLLLLGTYAMSPLLLLGWAITLLLFFFDSMLPSPGVLLVLALVCYSAMGNFAAFFEIGVACHLDGNGKRLRILPFAILGFLVSLVTISRATLRQSLIEPFRKNRTLHWDKTKRYRRQPG
ncbi:glycosyltransferase family 2 protein [Chromobacterium sp. LK11]|uniref:glycosyltransferase family 2 protein n=1 Tax=Chromobacterium sp. LK11 TaxID=1628212 RepID=UPI000A4F1361|nr:glycosyltransferase family 2 protein [Chromobacterium sp. LK11]